MVLARPVTPPLHSGALAALVALQHPARRFSLKRLGQHRVQGVSGHTPRLRGRGMTFEEHRAYAAGDEPRFIDWRVTARTGDMHIKIFREEHERPVLLLADVRPGMCFGTQRQFKSTLAAHACALLGWTAAHSRERIGGVICANALTESAPHGGAHGVLRWANGVAAGMEAAAAATQGAEAPPSLQRSLLALRALARPGAIVVVASDFADLDAAAEATLQDIARHTQVICLIISDPLETAPPLAGPLPLRQGEQTLWVDFRSADVRAHWTQHFVRRQQRVDALIRRIRAIGIPLSTAADATEQLRPWLALRR